MAGLFGMHVLTAETAAGGHGDLPHTMSASSMAGHDPGVDAGLGEHSGATVPADSSATVIVQMVHVIATGSSPWQQPAGEGHGGLGSCVLFLVVGGALTLLALLASRAFGGDAGVAPLAGAAVSLLRRRGPPGRYRPRVALCVIRV